MRGSTTVASCLLLLTAVLAFGATTSPTVWNAPAVRQSTPPPDEFEELPVWQCMNELDWAPLPIGDPANRARCWMGDIDYADSCNKVEWPVVLENEASVAQWMIIMMNGNGFHWGVRKPGCYAAGCVDVTVRSNYSIEVSMEGFENLLAVDDDAIDTVIEVEYAFSDQCEFPPAPDDESWMAPEEMNELSWEIEDSYDLHWIGSTDHIWAQIDVSPCNGPTEYVDPDWAVITYSLDDQQPWIDPETGLFSDMPAFPFQ